MTYDVTSWFYEQTLKKSSAPVRKYTIGSSDYSDRVTTWPTFSQRWNEVRPRTFEMKLANDDGALNFFLNNKITIASSCVLQMGYTHPTSGDELITMFSGRLDKIKYTGGTVSLRLISKFKQLGERVIGDSEVPQDYTGSNYLPSDLAWYIVTSHAGYSAIGSDTNPDIDYASFLAWASVFSADNVTCKSLYKGVKCTEALKRLADMTESAIFEKNNKLSFQRFSIADSLSTTLDKDSILNMDVELVDADILNRQHVMAAYVPSSRYYQIAVTDEASSSVNSYGLREGLYKDTQVWYVDSLSAINLAQRKTLIGKEPQPRINVQTTLVGMLRQIGEMVQATDNMIGMSSEAFRIMEQSINMDTGKVIFKGDASQILNAFTLDVSALDSSDVLV